MSRFLTDFLCFFLVITTSLASTTTYETIFEWISVDFEWPSEDAYNTAIADGSYIPKNNIITGVKMAGLHNNRTFVTVPRWRTGVPATLCEVKVNETGSPVLVPYPSWQYQSVDECEYLQYVQSMEIDADTGYMWILDTGRKYFLQSNISANNVCPPKLIVWDVVNNVSIASYTFPNEVAGHNTSFLNDVAIDPIRKIAYISDVLGVSNVTGEPGAIVIYDLLNNVSNRFVDDRVSVLSMRYDSLNVSTATFVHINNYTLFTQTNEDPIALSSDLEYVYFTSLSSFRMFRVKTETLLEKMYENDEHMNGVTSNTDGNNIVEFLGWKQSQCDGWTMDNTSALFHGSFNQTSLNKIETFENGSVSSEKIVVQDETDIQWIDTFAWSNDVCAWFPCFFVLILIELLLFC